MSSRADETGEILQFRNTVVVPVNRSEKKKKEFTPISTGKAVMCREFAKGATLCETLLSRNYLHSVRGRSTRSESPSVTSSAVSRFQKV